MFFFKRVYEYKGKYKEYMNTKSIWIQREIMISNKK